MKKPTAIDPVQHPVSGPIPAGTVLYALLCWIAKRVARELRAASDRSTAGQDSVESDVN